MIAETADLRSPNDRVAALIERAKNSSIYALGRYGQTPTIELTADAFERLLNVQRDLAANEGSEDARLAIAEAKIADLAITRDALRDHLANIKDKQPWDNQAMFEQLLATLETATKGN